MSVFSWRKKINVCFFDITQPRHSRFKSKWRYVYILSTKNNKFVAARGSSVGSDAAWDTIGTKMIHSFVDLVMKIFLWRFFIFCLIKKSICQLMTKECALSNGNPPYLLMQNSTIHGVIYELYMLTMVNILYLEGIAMKIIASIALLGA